LPALSKQTETTYRNPRAEGGQNWGSNSHRRGRCADINEIIAVYLARQGHTCTQAYSGTEGIMRLGGELASASGAASAMDKKHDAPTFDLIICDLMLPGATGEELIAAVRERDPELPVIVISARTSTTDRIDLLKLGADDYLTKPFDLDELAARVGCN